MTEESDGILLDRVLRGERDAFGHLVERYQERLGRYAYRMLGNRADAEDALQDTFLRAYRSLGRCNGPNGFGPWVFGILVNRCRTHGARRARRDRLLVADEGAMARAAVGHSEERDAVQDAVRWALERIPADQREAFLLKHVEGMSYEDMEAVTGVRAATLRMRVFRARDELRKLLQEPVQ